MRDAFQLFLGIQGDFILEPSFFIGEISGPKLNSGSGEMRLHNLQFLRRHLQCQCPSKAGELQTRIQSLCQRGCQLCGMNKNKNAGLNKALSAIQWFGMAPKFGYFRGPQRFYEISSGDNKSRFQRKLFFQIISCRGFPSVYTLSYNRII